MRDDYRITTPELDLAVEELNGAGAYGARMTGGGFGGCAIALVPGPVATVTDAATDYCTERGWAAADRLVADPSEGPARPRALTGARPRRRPSTTYGRPTGTATGAGESRRQGTRSR